MSTQSPSSLQTSSPFSTSSRPPLPKTFTYTSPPLTLRYQGAEALLYRTHYLLSPPSTASHPAALKHRPRKPYRHPLLDAKLTRHRILSEARILAKLRREGVSVPALYALDWEDGWILMEWIEGVAVRALLDESLSVWLKEGVESGELWDLMGRIGRVVGKMHERGVVHGDLTTSNILLKHREQEELEKRVVLIDFGLSEVSAATEDRAVDLYVLERAFGSTHPRTEGLFGELLRSYGESYQGAGVTLKKLEEVRMRGRKKIALG